MDASSRAEQGRSGQIGADREADGDGCYRAEIEGPVDPTLFMRAYRVFADASTGPLACVNHDTLEAQGMAAVAAMLRALKKPESDRLLVLHRLLSALEIMEHLALEAYRDDRGEITPPLLAAMAKTPCRLERDRIGFELNELLRLVDGQGLEARAG